MSSAVSTGTGHTAQACVQANPTHLNLRNHMGIVGSWHIRHPCAPQVVIFVKSVQRCIALAQLLVEQNFPAIAIHRGMPQEERLSRYQQFKDFQRRILVATNLFGRGMDIERVNIAFNYDMPEDSDTYLHRVARAGRFGTKGLAITFVSDENDAKILNDVQDRFEVNISELPDEIDISSYIEQTR